MDFSSHVSALIKPRKQLKRCASKPVPSRSANTTIRTAKKIYDEQKQLYQDQLKKNIRQGKSVPEAAHIASVQYKAMYGKTKTDRWNHALKIAKTR